MIWVDLCFLVVFSEVMEIMKIVVAILRVYRGALVKLLTSNASSLTVVIS